MNILLVCFENKNMNELHEFLNSQDHIVFSADNTLEAIQILNNNSIDEVFMYIVEILNIGLVSYINNHFSDVRVVLVTNSYVEQAFSIIKNCTCDIIHEPLTLSVFGRSFHA